MKYLDITLGSSPQGLIYPVGYQFEIGDFAQDHLYYKDGLVDKLLLAIPDKDYKPTMVRVNVVEVTETEAKAVSEANETRTMEIKDEAKVRLIEIKSRLGLTLTTEELDAIDPTKPDSAFGTSKIFADRIDDLKIKEVK